MARPLRIEFDGALYHVTSRGDRQEPIFEDGEDRQMFLRTVAEVVKLSNWLCHAYCLMTNHYHLLIETPDGNLSKGMRQLNGVYTQASNRRHNRSGHIFQGRFKAILADKESYLLELNRYIVLNPVRAGIVDQPQDWEWSSYRAMAGVAPSPSWLVTDSILAQYATRREIAQRRYRQFVDDGIDQNNIWDKIRQQAYLGNEQFIERVQNMDEMHGDPLSIPKVQRRPPAPNLPTIVAEQCDRNDAIVAAYATGAYSYRELADYFGLHLSTIGRVVRGSMQQ